MTTETKQIYVQINKPLVFKVFNKYKSPMGWYRLDILKRKLKENILFKKRFTLKELKQIEVLK